MKVSDGYFFFVGDLNSNAVVFSGQCWRLVTKGDGDIGRAWLNTEWREGGGGEEGGEREREREGYERKEGGRRRREIIMIMTSHYNNSLIT